MTDIDLAAAATIANAIEQAGGEIFDFETDVRTRQTGGITRLAQMAGGNHARIYSFDVVVPDDPSRDVITDHTFEGDRLETLQDLAGDSQTPTNDVTVRVLAALLEAGDNFDAGDMTAAQHLRAVVGQSDIPLALFAKAYLKVYDERPNWDIDPARDEPDDEDGADISID